MSRTVNVPHAAGVAGLAVAMVAAGTYLAAPSLLILLVALVLIGSFGWAFSGDRYRLLGIGAFTALSAFDYENWAGWTAQQDDTITAFGVVILAVAGWLGYLIGRTLRPSEADD